MSVGRRAGSRPTSQPENNQTARTITGTDSREGCKLLREEQEFEKRLCALVAAEG